MRTVLFSNRRDAGRRLASELRRYQDDKDVLVLALPRGGVPVALEVARSLHAPLDVFLVRKLGVPGHEDLRGRKIILVDDGLATGASMRAAVTALGTQGPAEIVVAVPTAPPETCRSFEPEVDRIICAVTPQPFRAVGLWYEDFSQTTDEEVREYLELASEPSRTDTAEVSP